MRQRRRRLSRRAARTTGTSPSTKTARPRPAMTNHVARLYAIALSLAVFFVTWAAVSARPWAAQASKDGSSPRRAADLGGTGASREHPRPACCEAPPARLPRRAEEQGKRQIAAIGTANAQAAATAAAATAAPSSSSWSAPASIGRRRLDAARDEHPHVVMERHGFRAMGTDVEASSTPSRTRRLRPGLRIGRA